MGRLNRGHTRSRTQDVPVQLSGEDGNVFFIVARVSRALKRAGFTKEAGVYRKAATACQSYDAVLQLTMETVNVS
jgi:hypothetical protein